MEADRTRREIPEEIDMLRRNWWRYFHRWWAIHYTLGIVGTVSSITVAAWPQHEIAIPYLLGTLSWTAAICVALLTVYVPSRRAKAYAAAWRILHAACNRYVLDSSTSPLTLVEAVEKGENIIAGSDPM